MNDPTATLTSLPPPPGVPFRLGTSRRPDGRELSADNRSLLLDGHPWMPAMGEFHYARYPADEWREELLKMKAAGIGIVASYVFWIHHEETPDAWDWSGCRDLRRFVATAAEAGLLVVVRGGPWCHGEVRNGGLPDWIVQRDGSRTRTTDPQFLAATRHLYEEIAREISGLLWKDGGPVIAFQVDNEYTGDGDYLLALKRLALEVGIDVPLFTRTGWPRLKSPVPHGELLPLYGGYAEGFWDRSIEPMPGHAWTAFVFSHRRIDTNIANDQLGQREAGDEEDAGQYPYLTCEIGGGMADSYHRRVLTTPADIEAIVMQKLGSGSTLPAITSSTAAPIPRASNRRYRSHRPRAISTICPSRPMIFRRRSANTVRFALIIICCGGCICSWAISGASSRPCRPCSRTRLPDLPMTPGNCDGRRGPTATAGLSSSTITSGCCPCPPNRTSGSRSACRADGLPSPPSP